MNFDHTWIDIECPQCGYSIEIQLIDIKSETIIFCHNCKTCIRLEDNEASIHNGINSINKTINDLDKIIKTIGK